LALPSASNTVAEPEKTETGGEVDQVHQAVVDLLSRLYDCDAAKEMLNMFSSINFTPVVKRRVDANAGEVHVDIDNVALRHLTISRSNMWIGSKLYEKAEATLESALLVWPNDKVLEYNMACSSSLRGDKVKALAMLEAAVTHGYDDAAQLMADSDLSNIRNCGRFKRLVAMARGESALETASDPVAPLPVEPVAVLPPVVVAAPQPTPAPVVAPPAPVVTSSVPNLEEPVATLMMMFPALTIDQARGVLRAHRGDLAHAANSLL